MTFLVQVGKGSKGSYSTRYSFGSGLEAWAWYKGINIGMGYKKRLVKIFEDGTRKTMTRSS